MFGFANQLLALIALTIVTTVLVNSGRVRYAPITLLPACFVATTTMAAAYGEMTGKYLGWLRNDATWLKGALNLGLTGLLVVCVAIITGAALIKWVRVLGGPGAEVEASAASSV